MDIIGLILTALIAFVAGVYCGMVYSAPIKEEISKLEADRDKFK